MTYFFIKHIINKLNYLLFFLKLSGTKRRQLVTHPKMASVNLNHPFSLLFSLHIAVCYLKTFFLLESFSPLVRKRDVSLLVNTAWLEYLLGIKKTF